MKKLGIPAVFLAGGLVACGPHTGTGPEAYQSDSDGDRWSSLGEDTTEDTPEDSREDTPEDTGEDTPEETFEETI